MTVLSIHDNNLPIQISDSRKSLNVQGTVICVNVQVHGTCYVEFVSLHVPEERWIIQKNLDLELRTDLDKH